jgi:hypothetical protein
MPSLVCPVCTTRFDTIFAAWDRCPYCIARGVDPPPALLSDPAPPVPAAPSPDEATAFSLPPDGHVVQ